MVPGKRYGLDRTTAGRLQAKVEVRLGSKELSAWKSRKLNSHPFVLLQTNLNRSSGHLGTMRLEFSLIHKPLSLYRKVLEAAQNLSDIFMQSEFALLGPASPTLARLTSLPLLRSLTHPRADPSRGDGPQSPQGTQGTRLIGLHCESRVQTSCSTRSTDANLFYFSLTQHLFACTASFRSSSPMPQFLPSPALAVRNWEIQALKSVSFPYHIARVALLTIHLLVVQGPHVAQCRDDRDRQHRIRRHCSPVRRGQRLLRCCLTSRRSVLVHVRGGGSTRRGYPYRGRSYHLVHILLIPRVLSRGEMLTAGHG